VQAQADADPTRFRDHKRSYIMSTTLVGLFSDPTQAEQAQQRLQAAGFDRQALQLNSTDPLAGEPGAIRRFFTELFGSTSNADVMERANAALTVDVADDQRVGEVRMLLEACGALEVDTPARAEPADARHLSEGDGLIHSSPAPKTYDGPERRVRSDLRYLGAERRRGA
jgi:hypothetical protein